LLQRKLLETLTSRFHDAETDQLRAILYFFNSKENKEDKGGSKVTASDTLNLFFKVEDHAFL